jgi:hypothetical protein
MRAFLVVWGLFCRYCQPRPPMTKDRFLSPGPLSLPTESARVVSQRYPN